MNIYRYTITATGEVFEGTREQACKHFECGFGKLEGMARRNELLREVIGKTANGYRNGLEAMFVIDNFIGDLAGKAAYCWGNIIKYLLRFQKKNGVEDLKKARQHLDWLIEETEKK